LSSSPIWVTSVPRPWLVKNWYIICSFETGYDVYRMTGMLNARFLDILSAYLERNYLFKEP
jgi:hypothetical protein